MILTLLLKKTIPFPFQENLYHEFSIHDSEMHATQCCCACRFEASGAELWQLYLTAVHVQAGPVQAARPGLWRHGRLPCRLHRGGALKRWARATKRSKSSQNFFVNSFTAIDDKRHQRSIFAGLVGGVIYMVWQYHVFPAIAGGLGCIHDHEQVINCMIRFRWVGLH